MSMSRASSFVSSEVSSAQSAPVRGSHSSHAPTAVSSVPPLNPEILMLEWRELDYIRLRDLRDGHRARVEDMRRTLSMVRNSYGSFGHNTDNLIRSESIVEAGIEEQETRIWYLTMLIDRRIRLGSYQRALDIFKRHISS